MKAQRIILLCAALLVCLVASTPTGPDVSSYQGTIDWKKVKGDDAKFAMAKATEGLTYKDPYFKKNWKGIKDAGIKVRGAYHFGHPNDNTEAQVEYFLSEVGNTQAGDFFVLDIESADKQSAAKVAKFSSKFVHLVRNATKRPVFVYTGEWFWDPQAGGSDACADFPLWVSGYSSSPPMPKGWKKWTFWQ
jgi:GH25 family lysozyme M1 (1,4-beta-N-acetylmuramidase)